jgi:hypothetical protein
MHEYIWRKGAVAVVINYYLTQWCGNREDISSCDKIAMVGGKE